MRIITPNEDNLIFLGKVGENEAVQVVLDVSEILSAFGDGGNFVLTNMRSEDTLGYPVIVTRDGSSVVWTVQSIDLAYAGEGKLEVTYYLGDTIAKSITYPTYVCASVTGGAEPPDPWKPIIDEILQARDEAVEAAGNAAESERNASASEQAASQSESNAHGSELAAGGSASSAETSALKSEGYAVGKQNGTPVESGSPYYHKNAAYYAAYANEKAEEVAQALGPINAHLADHNNPHQVTPSQIGAIEKVAGAVADNIAVLTADGNVADSGVSMTLEEELEGQLISFKAMAAVPLKALSVALSPIQSLNGYDSPWPAGGGKNKIKDFDAGTVGNATITKTADGRMVVNGNFNGRQNASDVTLTAGTYVFSIAYTAGSTGIAVQIEIKGSDATTISGSTLYVRQDTAYGVQTATITIPSDGLYHLSVYASGSVTNLTLGVQLESGSTATAFAPYSNICPISGRTEVTVWRTGKNLFAQPDGTNTFSGVTEKWENGILTLTASSATGEISSGAANWRNAGSCFLKAGTYKVKAVQGDGTSSGSIGAYLVKYSDGTRIQGMSWGVENTVTLTEDTEVCVSFYLYQFLSTGGKTINVCIVPNGQDSTYEPYNGNAYTIDLNGTVYGGTVDVTGGNGTDEIVRLDMGDLDWSKNASWGYYAAIPSGFDTSKALTMLCEAYKTVGATASPATGQITVYNGYFRVGDLSYADAAAFTTGVTGIHITYPLVTPSALTTTPTPVNTLKGDNNIWSDGDSVALTRYNGLAEIIAEIVSELNA